MQRQWQRLAFTVAALFILVAGCTTVVGVIIADATHRHVDDLNSHQDIARIKLGTPRRAVVAALGVPDDRGSCRLPEDPIVVKCIRYDIGLLAEGGSYTLIFDSDETLREKRYGS